MSGNAKESVIIRVLPGRAARALQDVNYLQFAPRTGFAYSLPGDRTVVRGGFGIFYGRRRIRVRRRAANRIERRRQLGPELFWDLFEGAIERLTLGLLIEGEHHRPLGRIKIEPDDINKLGLEVGVVGQFERVDVPRPQVPGLPDSLHRVLANPVLGTQRSR